MTQAIQKTLRDSAAGLDRLRNDAGFRGVPQRFRVLPHLRRHHPRQDGRALHRRTLSSRHARRSLREVVCRERIVHGKRLGNVVYRESELYSRIRRTGRLAVLSGHARLGEIRSLRIHDLRLRL